MTTLKGGLLLTILLGPPGAGKGTQAQLLSERTGMLHIATGDILRAEVAAGTDLGRDAKSYMDRGDLVPDHVMIGIIESRLRESDAQDGVILDGFPRTVVQAQALDEALQRLERNVDLAVSLKVSEPVLVDRIAGRGEGRADDRPESVKRRLQVYWEQTAPVLDYYRETGRLKEVEGERAPEEVLSLVAASIR